MSCNVRDLGSIENNGAYGRVAEDNEILTAGLFVIPRGDSSVKILKPGNSDSAGT